MEKNPMDLSQLYNIYNVLTGVKNYRKHNQNKGSQWTEPLFLISQKMILKIMVHCY